MIFDLSNEYKLQSARETLNALADKKSVIEIKEKKLKRSLDQNGLYWVWMTAIQVETGHEKNETHQLYRCKFLRKEDNDILTYLKEPIWKRAEKLIEDMIYFPQLSIIADIISRSTVSLETDEFSNYLKEIQNHARAHYNVILLNLKDKNFEAFYREYGFR
jgi:hypothetical protein